MALVDARRNTQKPRVTLVTRIHARDHPHAHHTRTPRQCRIYRRKRLVRQCVPDHEEFVPRHAIRGQPIRARAGIADHRITPAESDLLGAKLGGRHQVSQLPITSNHYRHSGQTCCRYKGERRIKIEGVSNLHTIASQVLGEPDPRAPRLPAVETSSQAKLRNFFKAQHERTIPTNAAQFKVESFRAETSGEDAKLALRTSGFEGVSHQEQPDRLIHRKMQLCLGRGTCFHEITPPSRTKPVPGLRWALFFVSLPRSAEMRGLLAGRTSPGSCDARVQTSGDAKAVRSWSGHEAGDCPSTGARRQR